MNNLLRKEERKKEKDKRYAELLKSCVLDKGLSIDSLPIELLIHHLPLCAVMPVHNVRFKFKTVGDLLNMEGLDVHKQIKGIGLNGLSYLRKAYNLLVIDFCVLSK